MSYYMNVRNVNFILPKSKFSKALQAVKDGVPGKFWDWIDSDAILRSETLECVMQECRWSPYFDDKGNINDLMFDGEKSGDDFEFFKILAPYVKRGSSIEMQGEDGYIWRWKFDGKTCVGQEGRVTFK